MQANKTQLCCGAVRLDVLLFGAEDSAEFQETETHVASCLGCQDRLATLAGSDADWAEARGALRQDELDADRTHGFDKAGPTGQTTRRPSTVPRPLRLDFLGPPSHPEMLGRLGRYEIESVIGAGGMGIVLKAFDTELNRPVAIKVLAPHLADSGAARQRFAREARAAAAVVHEHVVAIHNVESDGAVPFLVMQYVPGRSLADRVDQDGPLEPAEILRIGRQAAAGLAAAHAQGVIHRDIKPANILLENDVERVLLTDFGLARAAEDASLTRSGMIAGTPHYMSPEQGRGATIDARSDLFSLGAVLYFMATGHPPFRAEQAMAVLHRICHDRQRGVWEINPCIPDELAEVIDRLLEKKPSRRFATASEVQSALDRALSRWQQPRRWRAPPWFRRLRRRRWPLPAAVAIAATVAAMVWFSPGNRPSGPRANSQSALEQSRSGNVQDAGKSAANSAAGSPTSAAEVLAPYVDFVGQLATMNESLAKAGSPYPEAILLRQFRDPWSKELRAMDAQVARLEKLWSIDSKESSSPKTLKGASP